MLTNPNCGGTMDELNDAAADNDAYLAATDEREFIRRHYWQVRDLDRKLTRDSDEVTTW
jgi:hypothetical protein